MKNNNLIEWILCYYWYSRAKITAWRKGLVHFQVTPSGEHPLWQVWKEFHAHLLLPLLAGNKYPDFGKDEQDEILNDYIQKFNLTQEDAGNLHMSFSPNRIPEGLGYYVVKFQIEKNKHNKKFYENYPQSRW
jgi:hypothetical protein